MRKKSVTCWLFQKRQIYYINQILFWQSTNWVESHNTLTSVLWNHSNVHHYNVWGKACAGEVRSAFSRQWPVWVPRPVASEWELLCLNGVRDLHVHSSLPTSIWQCIFTGFDSELSGSYASRIIPTPGRYVGMMEDLGWSHYVCRGMCLARNLLCDSDPWQQF